MIVVLWVVRIFRRFVGRGLDPALQNEETGVQTLSARGKAKPTGGLQAAPTIGRKLSRVSPDCLMIAVLWVVRIFRRFVGRGLDPAAGTFRQGRCSRRIVRFTIGCRGGLQAARGAFPQPGTLRAMKTPCGRSPPPACPQKSPSCGSERGGQQYTECPKGRGKICRKNRKKVLTKGSPGGIIVKLSGAGARGGKPENRIGTAWNGFRERKVPDKVQKISKKFLTNERT